MKNRVKNMLKEGEVAIGTFVLTISSPNLMWMLGAAGFDFAYLDGEHSCFSIETIGELIKAARGAGVIPIVRPPTLDPAFLSRSLDAGALGVLVPHVETVEEVECIVKACKYMPEGQRGALPRQIQTNYRNHKDLQSLNQEILIGIVVESLSAVARVKELAGVPGVDLVFLGASDLAQDMGLGGDRNHPLVNEKVAQAVETCASLGVAVGVHSYQVEDAKDWISKGIRMLSFGSDISMIVDNNREPLRSLRASDEAPPANLP